LRITSVFIELVTKQFSFDFSITRKTLSFCSESLSFTFGKRCASVIKNFRSMSSNLMLVLHSKLSNSTLEFSAIARNVVIKQLLIAPAYKCSGDHIFGTPFANSGGVAHSMVLSNTGDDNSPIRPFSHFKST